MKKLSTDFIRHGIHYKLVDRHQDVVLFESKYAKPDVKNLWYEVFVVPTRESYILRGIEVPAHEYFPSDEDFGNRHASKSFFGNDALEKAKIYFQNLFAAQDHISSKSAFSYSKD